MHSTNNRVTWNGVVIPAAGSDEIRKSAGELRTKAEKEVNKFFSSTRSSLSTQNSKQFKKS